MQICNNAFKARQTLTQADELENSVLKDQKDAGANITMFQAV